MQPDILVKEEFKPQDDTENKEEYVVDNSTNNQNVNKPSQPNQQVNPTPQPINNNQIVTNLNAVTM